MRLMMRRPEPAISVLGGGLLQPATCLPLSRFADTIRRGVVPVAMLLTVFPESFVLPTVGPTERAKAVLLVVHVLATIPPAARPFVAPKAMDHGIRPLTLEGTAIVGHVATWTIDDIVLPSSFINGAICPAIDAVTLFLPVLETALILCSLDPGLDAIAILHILLPLASISCASLVVVLPDAVGHISRPFPNVEITIAMKKLSKPFGSIRHPLAAVCRAIRPALMSHAMSHPVLPLALVDGTRSEREGFVPHIVGSTGHFRLNFFELFCFPFEVAGFFSGTLLSHHECFRWFLIVILIRHRWETALDGRLSVVLVGITLTTRLLPHPSSRKNSAANSE
mmetsp:Transcript_64381/g.141144  ORF Transcript_64381/g.141144 Transcript_64381/m.141144 type:complete len:338 (+) Transcript_64381:27-1040(+)